jgi:hypothetical protein
MLIMREAMRAAGADFLVSKTAESAKLLEAISAIAQK